MSPSYIKRQSSRYLDAIRILFLLSEAGVTPSASCPENYKKVIHTQTRLQALDFWMRNPDYLANELLNDIEAGKRPKTDLNLVDQILKDDEPLIRRYPMIRYLFGAYEPLDDALAILRARELIIIRRDGNLGTQTVREHHYYLLTKGEDALDLLLEEYPNFIWYRRRAEIVAALAGVASGPILKKRQYKEINYAETQLGSRIAPILDKVRVRRVQSN